MDKSEIAGRVREILTPFMPADIPEDRYTPTAHLEADLEIDSMDRLELILQLEEEINGDISPSESAKLKTVADVQALLEKALA